MNKNVMSRFRFLFIMPIAAFCFMGCAEAMDVVSEVVKPPSISVRNVLVSGISSDSLDLDLDLAIDNPNPVGLYLSGVDYNLELADTPLASSRSSLGIDIRPADVSRTRIPIAVAYNQVKSIYDRVRGQDEIPYRFSGDIHINTPIGDIPIPFDIEGTLPVIRPPRVSGVSVSAKSLSLAGADMNIEMHLQNPNAFPLDIRRINYNMLVEGEKLAKGSLLSQSVPANSSGTISLPVSLDSAVALSWIKSMISKGKADYSLNYDATYLLKGHPVKHQEKMEGKAVFGW